MKSTALEHACPVGYAVGALSGRWRSSILCALLDEGQLRFMTVQRRTSAKAGRAISRKVLAAELSDLEAIGLVRRSVGHTTKPPLETYYELTPWGAELGPVVQALLAWSYASPVMADERARAARTVELQPARTERRASSADLRASR